MPTVLPLLAVCGPTASGKSELSIKLAQKLNSAVINVDSVQIYKHFNIGSAKVTSQQQHSCQHYLIDILEPKDKIDAAMYVRFFDKAYSESVMSKHTPVLCVGTTMYFSAILHGLVAVPSASLELRQYLNNFQTDELYQQLIEVDPLRAQQLQKKDRLRIQRAVEAYLTTKRPLSLMHQQAKQIDPKYRALMLVLCWKRQELHQRIAQRTQQIITGGLLNETQAIVSSYGKDCVALQSVGYRQSLQVLNGELESKDLQQKVLEATRQLAKRQITYLRNEPIKRSWKTRPVQVANDSKPKQALEFKTEKLSFESLLSNILTWYQQPNIASEVWYLDASLLVNP